MVLKNDRLLLACTKISLELPQTVNQSEIQDSNSILNYKPRTWCDFLVLFFIKPWRGAPQQPTPWPRGSASASHSAVHACACSPLRLHPAVVALSKIPIRAGRSKRCVCSYTLKCKAWIFLSRTPCRVNASALTGKLEGRYWSFSFFRASVPGLSENRDLTGARLVWMCLIKEDGTNVKGCSHMQLWAVLRGNTRISSGHEGLEVSGLCRQRPGRNRAAVRKDEFAPRRANWYFCWTRLENSGRNFHSFAPISNFFHQRSSRTEVYWCLKPWSWYFLSGCFRCKHCDYISRNLLGGLDFGNMNVKSRINKQSR